MAGGMSNPDFVQATVLSFSDHVSPPVPFDDASPHGCYEAVESFLGEDVTPERPSKLSDQEIEELASAFGRCFEVEPPSSAQIRQAIRATLHRWPPGST